MKSIFVLLLFLCSSSGFAQQKYWVFFTDKNGVEFDPYTFFHPNAIERRIKNGLSLYDTTDFPLNPNYIHAVAQRCDSISNHSRWFNALAVYGNEAQMEEIRTLPFVAEVEEMWSYDMALTRKIELKDFSPGMRELLRLQTERMHGSAFAKNGITGKGIRVCIIDAGFTGFKETEALKHAYNRGYVKMTYDFVREEEEVFLGHEHGTMVSSSVAGKVDSVTLGMAPQVEFLLARSEKVSADKLREEENWLAAMEWADKNGAHIINSSLGYTVSRYFRKDMNGKMGLISRAATMASRKGILVVSSAGNEGDGIWKIVAAPGDADSVLTVGGINPWTGIHASWSSYGPTNDKRLKPNVSAFGNAIVGFDQGYMEQAGTSFASPLVAGFAACVMQMYPNLNNMQVLQLIERSADLYPYYDYAHGYGVPNALFFTDSLFKDSIQKQHEPTFRVIVDSLNVSVVIDSAFFHLAEPVQSDYYKESNGKTQKEVESSWHEYHLEDRSYSTASPYVYSQLPDYLFYHVQNREGYLKTYYVISVHQTEVLKLDRKDFTVGEVLRIFYKGYSFSIEF
jgi:subtilisin family serine protease